MNNKKLLLLVVVTLSCFVFFEDLYSQKILYQESSTNSSTYYGISGSWRFILTEYRDRDGNVYTAELEPVSNKRGSIKYRHIYGMPKITIRKDLRNSAKKKYILHIGQNPFEYYKYKDVIIDCKLSIGNKVFKRKYRDWSNLEIKQIIKLFIEKSKGSIEFTDPLGKKHKLIFNLNGFTKAWDFCIKFQQYNPIEKLERNEQK